MIPFLKIAMLTGSAVSVASSKTDQSTSHSTSIRQIENRGESIKFHSSFLDSTSVRTERRMSSVGGVPDLPFIEYAHPVEFHFLLSSLPYNTEPSLAALFSQISVGTELPSFHVGLGIWDTFSDTKISVEFVPNNMLSCLLPKLADGKIVWDNSGFIAVTNPMSSSTSSAYSGSWRESRLVSTSSGIAYQDLVKFLTENEKKYTIYQPINIINPVKSESTTSTTSNTTLLFKSLNVLLHAQDSTRFLSDLLSQIAGFGCKVETFLQVYATALTFPTVNPKLPVVSWTENESADSDVYQWFTDLTNCYEELIGKSDEGKRILLEMDTTSFSTSSSTSFSASLLEPASHSNGVDHLPSSISTSPSPSQSIQSFFSFASSLLSIPTSPPTPSPPPSSSFPPSSPPSTTVTPSMTPTTFTSPPPSPSILSSDSPSTPSPLSSSIPSLDPTTSPIPPSPSPSSFPLSPTSAPLPSSLPPSSSSPTLPLTPAPTPASSLSPLNSAAPFSPSSSPSSSSAPVTPSLFSSSPSSSSPTLSPSPTTFSPSSPSTPVSPDTISPTLLPSSPSSLPPSTPSSPSFSSSPPSVPPPSNSTSTPTSSPSISSSPSTSPSFSPSFSSTSAPTTTPTVSPTKVQLLTQCYGKRSYAYVYASPNSVYNVSLLRNKAYSSPSALEYVYALPYSYASIPIGLTIIDKAAIGFFFLLVLMGAYYIFHLLTKPKPLPLNRSTMESYELSSGHYASHISSLKDADSLIDPQRVLLLGNSKKSSGSSGSPFRLMQNRGSGDGSSQSTSPRSD